MQPSVQATSCNGTHFQELFDRTAAAVAATDAYRRHQGADHVLVSNSWKVTERPPKQVPWSKLGQRPNDYFRHVFRNAIVGHMETRHGGDGGFWRCSVVSPYTANLDDAHDEAAGHHLVPPTSRERDVSFYFQGGANNRGTYGYAFRQAALAQLSGFPKAHVSAFSLPGSPQPCRGGVTTNCKAARSNGAFRGLMRRARFNLVLRGDSPSSRRLYDGLAYGALSVLVSDHTWSVGLPFGCMVPWRRMAFTLSERAFSTAQGARGQLEALEALAPPLLARMQRIANRFRRDVLWNVNNSRVAENILITSALRCLPAHVTRGHRAGRPPAVLAAVKQLRSLCPFGDLSIACRTPDGANCAGCETGDLAGGTPIEHCCADSCPSCNRSTRCLPPDIYFGDPLISDPVGRRGALESYLGQKDKELTPALRQWRAGVGKPSATDASAAARRGTAVAGGRPAKKAGLAARLPAKQAGGG